MRPLSLAKLVALYRAVRDSMDDPYDYPTIPSRIRLAYYDLTREEER